MRKLPSSWVGTEGSEPEPTQSREVEPKMEHPRCWAVCNFIVAIPWGPKYRSIIAGLGAYYRVYGSGLLLCSLEPQGQRGYVGERQVKPKSGADKTSFEFCGKVGTVRVHRSQVGIFLSYKPTREQHKLKIFEENTSIIIVVHYITSYYIMLNYSI